MCPIFQTSANLTGEPAPADLTGVPAEMIATVDLAIDGGVLPGIPSTVVDLTALEVGGEWSVLREGGMSAGELRELLRAL